MKKILFATAALAAMASCSNNELIDMNRGEGISFRTSLDKATRANAANVITQENLTQFKVAGIGNNATYMPELLVTKSGAVWNTASIYYWPSYELKFFAYAPTSLDHGTVSLNHQTQTITGFSAAADVVNQKDLLVSCNTGNKANNETLGVAMNFKHALSQIEIQAKNSNSNIKIEVKGVRIVNAGTTANFTFPTVATTAEYGLPQSNWVDLSGQNTGAYKVKGGDVVELASTAKSIMFGDKNFMLIPQQLVAWAGNTETTGAYISVLCRIYSKNGEQYTLLYPQPTDLDNKDGKYAYASVPIATNWLPGKKYIYTLEFCSADSGGNGGGLIDPKPDNETDPDVDPTPKPDSKGGDSVLNGPIKFTVTVDSWLDQSEAITMQ